MLLDTYAPYNRVNIMLKFKSKPWDNVKLTKINICEKHITYKLH